MKPAVTVLLLISVLTVLMIIWIAPVVGLRDSSCEQYPLSAGCRLPGAGGSTRTRSKRKTGRAAAVTRWGRTDNAKP